MSHNQLTVTEAVNTRMSVRAFLPRPVPKALVLDILETARRTPSGGNVQPWRVDVLGGEALDKFKQIVHQRMMSGVKEPTQYDIYPDSLWEPHRSYRYKVGEDMYGEVGIAREDKAGRLKQLAANYRFFDAPVGLFFSMSRRMGVGQWSDLGMLMQTIMLLAVERGLASCAQECWSYWPETVAEFLGLEDDIILFSGMALGYADFDAPINRLRTDRADLESFVTLRGFD